MPNLSQCIAGEIQSLPKAMVDTLVAKRRSAGLAAPDEGQIVSARREDRIIESRSHELLGLRVLFRRIGSEN